jgi:hypothetical protein
VAYNFVQIIKTSLFLNILTNAFYIKKMKVVQFFKKKYNVSIVSSVLLLVDGLLFI